MSDTFPCVVLGRTEVARTKPSQPQQLQLRYKGKATWQQFTNGGKALQSKMRSLCALRSVFLCLSAILSTILICFKYFFYIQVLLSDKFCSMTGGNCRSAANIPGFYTHGCVIFPVFSLPCSTSYFGIHMPHLFDIQYISMVHLCVCALCEISVQLCYNMHAVYIVQWESIVLP